MGLSAFLAARRAGDGDGVDSEKLERRMISQVSGEFWGNAWCHGCVRDWVASAERLGSGPDHEKVAVCWDSGRILGDLLDRDQLVRGRRAVDQKRTAAHPEMMREVVEVLPVGIEVRRRVYMSAGV